ncbi:MAG TPA: hypothetical protein DDX19_26845 [Rhodopirellula baltica]|nr:hypothetical protein [Rhodopirellula baltica]
METLWPRLAGLATWEEAAGERRRRGRSVKASRNVVSGGKRGGRNRDANINQNSQPNLIETYSYQGRISTQT